MVLWVEQCPTYGCSTEVEVHERLVQLRVQEPEKLQHLVPKKTPSALFWQSGHWNQLTRYNLFQEQQLDVCGVWSG